MRQAPGCSAARAEAIVRAFDSPLALMLALERAADGGGTERASVEGGEGEGGRASGEAERMARVDELLAGLTCSGGAGTNKLPKPLRRLLCRLFLGETAAVGLLPNATRDQEPAADAGAGGLEVEEVFGGGEQHAWDVEPMSQDDPY